MADENLKAWYDLRKRVIHERVSVYDILRQNGVSFRHSTEREEQFSCPFHGKDEKPSARVYPSSPRGPSHAWCFVCRERWDVISLWKKYHGEEKSFHRILSEIEKHYGITPPPVPEGAFDRTTALSSGEEDKKRYDFLYEAVERRVRDIRDDYVRINDMQGYLLAGSILDKVSYQVSEGQLSYKDAVEVLNKLLKKVAERIRGGSSSQAPHAGDG